MSKYQEALDRVKEIYKNLCDEFNLKKTVVKMNEDVEVLQELVDKATPKKPIYKDDLFVSQRYFFCTHCGSRFPKSYNFIDQMMYPYCPYCGGRQDWSDNK